MGDDRDMSRSRSRSRSPDAAPRRGRSESPRGGGRDRSRSRSPSPVDTVSMNISDQDAAFVLGKGGSTKNKLARVSGARLELHERDLRLDITGTSAARKRASEYIGFVLAQRVGPVTIDFSEKREDLSVVTVPEDCVGYVMGRGGQALRGMEEEWGTLMFFAKVAQGQSGEGSEKLAIFGTRRARRGAELKVMSAVEHKHPGHFLTQAGELRDPLNQPGDNEGDGWNYDMVPLSNDEFSYALGAMGSTRKKLARAADCIMEYVGGVAIVAGFKSERRRAKDYLSWLLQQRRGVVSVDTRDRDDVTVVEVPRDSVGFITGHKGESLRQIEAMSGTFCFADGEKGAAGAGKSTERLLIFGASEDGRRHAKRIIEDKIAESQYRDRARSGGGGGGGYGGGGRGGYDDRDRGRYDDRDRDRDRDRYDDRDRGRYDDRDRDRGRYDDRDRGRDRDRYDDRDRDRDRSRSRDRR